MYKIWGRSAERGEESFHIFLVQEFFPFLLGVVFSIFSS